MVKKISKTLAALCFYAFCLAPLFGGEDWQPQPIGPFGTLNTRDNSFAIPASSAQDLLNVDLTPGGKSVKKRRGYGLAFTLAITTSPVHGVYSFYDASGNDVSLFFNDTRMTASVNGGSTAVLFSTGTNGATYQCSDSLGFAYCANSNRTTITKTNGATYSSITNVSSTGTMVASCPTRLAMAGFSDAPSRIDFSAETDFTTWGTGSLGSSAAQFTVNAPGAKITHITYAFGRLMWFKDSSFGYILIGNQPFQSDWVIKTISYDVGTNDNSSVYREGVLYFRGRDGHIYAFDGSNYQRITKEISGTVNASQIRSANSWTQTSQSDFGAGFTPNYVYVDTETSPGEVRRAYPDDFGSLNDGTNGTRDNWDKFTSGTATGTITANGTLNVKEDGGSLGRVGLKSHYLLLDFQQGTTYHIKLNSSSIVSVNSLVRFYLVLSTVPSLTTNPDSLSSNFYCLFLTTAINPTIWTLNSVSDNTDGTLYAGTKVINSAGFLLDLYLATTTWAVSISNLSGTVLEQEHGTHTWPHNQVYAYLSFENGREVGSPCTFILDDFQIAPETATWQSAVKNAPNITSWDSLDISASPNGGTQAFYIRASNTVFFSSDTAPSWTAITNGAIPTISTGSYFQVRYDATAPLTSNTPAINDFTQNWFEGNSTDKAYATYFEDKILWEIASGAGATANNTTLVYDLLNQGWLRYDLPVNGFYVRLNKLYFGSANGGYIYKYGDIDNDNGAAINAYWKSKDFFGGDPFTNQELANISVIAKSVANSSMTVTYVIDGNTSASYTMPEDGGNAAFINKNTNLPAGTISSEYNVKFGNNAIDQYFEVFGIQVGIRPKSWVPN